MRQHWRLPPKLDKVSRFMLYTAPKDCRGWIYPPAKGDLVQKRTSLWQNPNFVKLWLGQTVSKFGSQIGSAAIYYTALLVLAATPEQLGVLGAVGAAPMLLVSLFAGVWADRVRRRPLLIAADVGRAVLVGSIPVAAVLEHR